MDTHALLKRIPLFDEIPEDRLQKIAENAEIQTFAAGSAVFEVGDQGDALYIILSGSVEVLIRGEGDAIGKSVARLGADDCFGEMALLSGEARSATVRVLEECRLLTIYRRDFTLLVSDVAFYQRMVNLLCGRLRRTDEQLDEVLKAQVALSRHLHDCRLHMNEELAGRTVISQKLDAAAEAAAGGDGPVLIEGETGSGKSLVAALIARGSRRADGPFISVDCAELGNMAPAELFGLDPDDTADNPGRRIGVLELCASGTVVIKEPQALSSMAQDRLVRTILENRFTRIGGSEDIALQARIVLTRRTYPDKPPPSLNAAMRERFAGNHIKIPPLRSRRRDIPIIAYALIRKLCRSLNRPLKALTPRAIEQLLSHDWPGNVYELDAVLRRAVIMSPDERIDAEQILIRLPAFSSEGRADLLKIRWLKRLMRSRWYPGILQVPATFILGLIIYLAFFGPQDESNMALMLTWPIWWAALPLSFLFLGRIWCTVCPFSLISSLVQRVGCLNLKIPKFFRRTEIWPMIGFFLFLTWADEFWHYPDVPMYTGMVLTAVFGGTLLFSMIHEHRVWCRYLCPLGGVNGVYSATAMAEVRTNSNVCAHHCKEHDCVISDTPHACPMFERPMAMDTNRNCNLCMNCLKACPHDAVHLFVRPPAAEMWSMRSPMLSAGVLSVLLSGTMLTHAYCRYLHHHGLELMDAPPASWLGLAGEPAAWTFVYLLGLIVPLIIAMGTSRLSAIFEERSWSDNLAHFGLTHAVLAVLMHIALEGAEFLEEGIPYALALVFGWLGASVDPHDYALFTPFFLKWGQVAIAAMAIGLTLYTILKVTRQRLGTLNLKVAGPHLVTAGIIGLLFLLLLVRTPI